MTDIMHASKTKFVGVLLDLREQLSMFFIILICLCPPAWHL